MQRGETMKQASLILIAIFLTGCAQLGAKVTLPDGTIMSERAYMAQTQYVAEAACHESRKIELPDNPTPTQALSFAVASMAMQNANPCNGTNVNDVAIAKTRARWAFAGILARAGQNAFGVALVNGDSSLQSFVVDSELKQSPLADEQNDLDNSNGEGFNDADGTGNTGFEL